MSRPLRVLLVEDSEDDAVLIVRELRKGGYAPEWRRVDTAASMKAALAEQAWDIVISDHSMPGFDALAALALYREKGLDVPFLIVSGVIQEEIAIAAMRAGAHDYLRKDNLSRLTAAVERELKEAAERQARREAQAELRRYREHLEQLVAARTAELEARNAQLAAEIRERERAEEAVSEREHELRLVMDAAPALISYVDETGRYRRFNETYEEWLGLSPNRIEGRHLQEVLGETAYAIVQPYVQQVLAGRQVTYQREVPFPGGRKRWLDVTYVPDSDPSGHVRGFVVLGVDIGELREAEERARASLVEKEAAERARAELAENLSNEIAHRVKNNLAMVAGLVQMQLLQESDAHTTEALRDAIGRIRTFAALHEQMYGARTEQVDLLATLQRIGSTIGELFPGRDRVTIVVDGDRFQCHARVATNLSVIANELITNALKYGGPGRAGPRTITVTLHHADDGVVLSVWNSGPPVSAGFDLARVRTMGLRLVQDMVGRYQGSFRLTPSEGGTRAEVVVPDGAIRADSRQR